MYCNGALHWSARRVKIIPDSSAEAETAVASRAAKETVSVRLVLVDMGAEVHGPTTILLTDCKAARDIIIKVGSSHRTKYFERATMLVKRLYMLHVIDPMRIPTTDMIADALTNKAVGWARLAEFRNCTSNQDRGPGTLGTLFIGC